MSKTLKTALEVIRLYQQAQGVVIVPERSRNGTLARVWGRADCLNVETAVFSVAGRLMPAYRGGYWDFVKLRDGAFYMALDASRQFRVAVDGNGFEGEVSGDAAGIIVCLTTYSLLSFQAKGELQRCLVEHFHKLRAYAIEHPESLNIFMAID